MRLARPRKTNMKTDKQTDDERKPSTYKSVNAHNAGDRRLCRNSFFILIFMAETEGKIFHLFVESCCNKHNRLTNELKRVQRVRWS